MPSPMVPITQVEELCKGLKPKRVGLFYCCFKSMVYGVFDVFVRGLHTLSSWDVLRPRLTPPRIDDFQRHHDILFAYVGVIHCTADRIKIDGTTLT